ncbi:MAG: hypothetical protein K5648_05505 [Erysipelotrichaceae bacterium]|nr:hypothetical protein [Erysipelotrichaceae bacterium]
MSLNEKDSAQLEKRYASFQKKRERLKEDSFEKRRLKDFFLSRKQIEERFVLEKLNKEYFSELPENKKGHDLIKIFERERKIDFSLISFKKIFLDGNLERFTKLLLKEDKELQKFMKETSYSDLKVCYLEADEENGRISYKIGIYA